MGNPSFRSKNVMDSLDASLRWMPRSGGTEFAGVLHHGAAASDAGKRAVRESNLLLGVALTANAALRQLGQPASEVDMTRCLVC